MKLKKIIIGLILIVLLPALFYTAYEITALNENESLITQIYEQQLDAILFSVNQDAWTISNTWANRIKNILTEKSRQQNELLLNLIGETSAIDAILLLDSVGQNIQYINKERNALRELPTLDSLSTVFRKDKNLIQRLIRRQKSGYTKLEPLTFASPGSNEEILVLLFVADITVPTNQIAGLVFNSSNFIQEVLTPRFLQIASEKFVIGIFELKSGRQIYATGEFPSAEIQQKRNIWLFPNYVIAIRMPGESIEELAQNRFYRSLKLIILLDLILLLGVWIIYRNIRTEMQLAQMKSDFVSNVSHELRTPLALIRMFAETLEMERIKSEEKKKEYYQIIGQETERLTHLINNILDFSKIEAGIKQYEMQKVNVNEAVEDVLRLYSFHLNSRGFRFEKKLAAQELLIRADRDALSEALINLLDNAIKYSDSEKFVRITTGNADNQVFIDVEDHGIGISAEEQKKIFDKFYRVSSGLVHNTKGSGLGLTLIKYIIEMHQGQITVKSQPGKGSTFRLVFPKI